MAGHKTAAVDGAPTDDDDLYETVVKKYGWRMRQLMEELADILREDHDLAETVGAVVSDVVEHPNDQLTYDVSVVKGDKRVDLSFELIDSRDHEGHDEMKVAFGISVTKDDGILCGGLVPFNYTEDLWIDPTDDEAIKTRLTLIEETWSPFYAATLAAEHLRSA